jgi:hypothetical protein
MFSIGLVAGLFIGAFLIVVLMSLLIVSVDSSSESEEKEKTIIRAGMA